MITDAPPTDTGGNMKTYNAKIFSQEKYKLGESPFYDPRTKTISWVDIMNKKLFTLGPDGVRKTFTFNQAIGAAVPTEKEGCYLIAGTDGLYLQNTESAGSENPAPKLIRNLKDYLLRPTRRRKGMYLLA